MPETVTRQVPTSIAPIDTMNKTELYHHLNRLHPGMCTYGLTSKSSRAEMERAHAGSHNKYDFTKSTSIEGPTSRVENPAVAGDGLEHPYYAESVHEHVVVASVPSESDRELLESITVDGVQRVLNAGERKALERLIDNDFATLRTEMIGYAAAILQERLETVKQEFADKQRVADTILADVIDTVNSAADVLAKRVDDAAKKGVKVTLPNGLVPTIRSANYAGGITSVVEGLVQAKTDITAENQADLRTALNTLERQRLSAQRLVLIAGISPEGQKLLATVPTAKSLMVSAAGERAALTDGS